MLPILVDFLKIICQLYSQFCTHTIDRTMAKRCLKSVVADTKIFSDIFAIIFQRSCRLNKSFLPVKNQ